MTATAKRRWSRELDSEVDGIAFGNDGPVLLHLYDPPAGGKWTDDAIPGKLGAYDRQSGERLWLVPCEVGYGRGFGAGFGQQGQVLVLGPGAGGHLIIRASVADGELLESSPIEPFDDALVSPDVAACLSAGRVSAIDTLDLQERWVYQREGERFHYLARSGDHLLVVVSNRNSGYGVLRLGAADGSFQGYLIEPSLPVIRGITSSEGYVVIVTSELERALPPASHGQLFTALAQHPDGGVRDTVSLLGMRADAEAGAEPAWFRILETRPVEDLADVSISADSGKVYLERRALLEALDVVSGRALGEWTVPGLDEQVDWNVVQGAGLLAEETRLSMFELPA